jgi:uncharacterized hydrophobic protein (TIGR00341 family)
MSLRLVEIICPAEEQQLVRRVIEKQSGATFWKLETVDMRVLFKVILDADDVESVLDPLRDALGDNKRFGAVVLPMSTSIPRVEEQQSTAKKESKSKRERVSREELIEEIGGSAKANGVYALMVVLSTIVASLGLVRDNASVIIGAMVIAPLLGPNMALSLATVLGEGKLARQALRANVVGFSLAILCAGATALVFPLSLESSEVLARTDLHVSDVLIALAAGIAGALVSTTGVAMSLVGVMVAVAILPPTCVAVMLAAQGWWEGASGAALVVVTNIVCVNAAGVGTYLVRGYRPHAWWREDSSRKTALVVLAMWGVLIAALIGAIVLRGAD